MGLIITVCIASLTLSPLAAGTPAALPTHLKSDGWHPTRKNEARQGEECLLRDSVPLILQPNMLSFNVNVMPPLTDYSSPAATPWVLTATPAGAPATPSPLESMADVARALPRETQQCAGSAGRRKRCGSAEGPRGAALEHKRAHKRRCTAANLWCNLDYILGDGVPSLDTIDLDWSSDAASESGSGYDGSSDQDGSSSGTESY